MKSESRVPGTKWIQVGFGKIGTFFYVLILKVKLPRLVFLVMSSVQVVS